MKKKKGTIESKGSAITVQSLRNAPRKTSTHLVIMYMLRNKFFFSFVILCIISGCADYIAIQVSILTCKSIQNNTVHSTTCAYILYICICSSFSTLYLYGMSNAYRKIPNFHPFINSVHNIINFKIHFTLVTSFLFVLYLLQRGAVA